MRIMTDGPGTVEANDYRRPGEWDAAEVTLEVEDFEGEGETPTVAVIGIAARPFHSAPVGVAVGLTVGEVEALRGELNRIAAEWARRRLSEADGPQGYVIRSNSLRLRLDGQPAYWSNTDGWGARSTATVFTAVERATLNLPIADDVEWVPA